MPRGWQVYGQVIIVTILFFPSTLPKSDGYLQHSCIYNCLPVKDTDDEVAASGLGGIAAVSPTTTEQTGLIVVRFMHTNVGQRVRQWSKIKLRNIKICYIIIHHRYCDIIWRLSLIT